MISIDIGNTLLKLAVWQQGVIIENYSTSKFEDLIYKLDLLAPKLVVCSAVSGRMSLIEQIQERLKNKSVKSFKHSLTLPIKNEYKNPNQLGQDRLAVAIGANFLSPNQNVLVIDAGTCITYDFINHKAEYKGGSISLGIKMRYKALKHFTHGLPELSKVSDTELLGKDTATCIESGVINGTISEIKGIIAQYQYKFEPLKVYVCGGDADFLYPHLTNKNSELNKNLLHIGLYALALYNKW